MQITIYPGECSNVCAACGARVIANAQVAPFIHHRDGCGRTDWPVLDAIEYDDGSHASVTDWPNGVERYEAVRLFEPAPTPIPGQLSL